MVCIAVKKSKKKTKKQKTKRTKNYSIESSKAVNDDAEVCARRQVTSVQIIDVNFLTVAQLSTNVSFH